MLTDAANHGKPDALVSGRYSAYKVPAKSAFHDAKHIRVQSFPDNISNNLIACFNKQFKAWYKTKQGFSSFESANNLISIFVFFFNFVHRILPLVGLPLLKLPDSNCLKNKNVSICSWHDAFLRLGAYSFMFTLPYHFFDANATDKQAKSAGNDIFVYCPDLTEKNTS